MVPHFEHDTAVEEVGAGHHRATLDRAWWVQRGPNGGYLAAIILRAILATVDDPARSPRSLTIHYMAPPDEGVVDIVTSIERRGRSMTSCSARLTQDARLLAVAMSAVSAPRPGPEFCDVEMPSVAAPGDLPDRPLHPEAPPFARQWDTRWAVGTPPLGEDGTPASNDRAVGGSWMRLAEPQLLDAPAIAALADAHIPPILGRAGEPLVVPTIDLTVHFRRPLPHPGLAADDFVLAVFRTDAAADGFMEEDGEIWAPDGTLLAQSRQLAVLLPLPEG